MLLLLILIISLVLQLFLPWWIIGVVAFVFCIAKAKNGKQAFFHSFGAIFILWTAAAFYQSAGNEHILANRIGEMFMLHLETNWIIIVLITGILGGLAAAMAGLAGYFSKSVFLKG